MKKALINKKDIGLTIWMIVLVAFLITILAWGIIFVEEEKNKVAIFGVIAVTLAAFTSVLTMTINNRKAKEREYELHVLKEKQKAYEHFYNVVIEMFKNTLLNKNTTDKKKFLTSNVANEMFEFKKGLMNWGSENLINEFIKYEAELNKSSTGEHFVILKAGDKFLKELRKELGFDDKGQVNLMSILLNHDAREELKEFL